MLAMSVRRLCVFVSIAGRKIEFSSSAVIFPYRLNKVAAQPEKSAGVGKEQNHLLLALRGGINDS